MNHDIDNINLTKKEDREKALLVLPVAFDNQGGLASTEQRGELPVCAVGSVQQLSCLPCNVSGIILKAKKISGGWLTRRISL